jgi:hypothetical protein
METMTMRSKSAYFLAIILGVVLLAEVAFSQGIGLTTGGPTLARNGLYIAGTDGLTAAMMNPAGVVYLNGRALELSIFDRLEQHDYDSPTQGLFRSYREDNFSFGGGAYWVFSPNLASAITYYQPLDYQVNWPFAMAFTRNQHSRCWPLTCLIAFRLTPFLLRWPFAGNLAFGMAATSRASAHRVSIGQ